MSKSTESTRFLEVMKQIVSVPKAEIDRREAEYKKAKGSEKGSEARVKNG